MDKNSISSINTFCNRMALRLRSRKTSDEKGENLMHSAAKLIDELNQVIHADNEYKTKVTKSLIKLFADQDEELKQKIEAIRPDYFGTEWTAYDVIASKIGKERKIVKADDVEEYINQVVDEKKRLWDALGLE